MIDQGKKISYGGRLASLQDYIGMVTPSHKVVRLPMIMFMHMVELVNLASRSSRRKNALILYLRRLIKYLIPLQILKT
jgi:hypothetical protein